jgi:hypothetical protein
MIDQHLALNGPIPYIPPRVWVFNRRYCLDPGDVIGGKVMLTGTLDNEPLIPGIRTESVINAVFVRHVHERFVSITVVVPHDCGRLDITVPNPSRSIQIALLPRIDPEQHSVHYVHVVACLDSIALSGSVVAALMEMERITR